MAQFKYIPEGSITSPQGFQSAGITAGLKMSGKPDMALIKSIVPANFAGAYTSCTFAAAPVQLCKKRSLNNDKIQAVIINSGNANACTGRIGNKNAEAMAQKTAECLNISEKLVMVSSTGRIGTQLDMNIINNGIVKASKNLNDTNGIQSAKAIMTTDTLPKYAAVEVECSTGKFTIGAMTKGAGMIDPKMTVPHATMLCYITTDAEVENALLQKILAKHIDQSFNAINIDGDMSTNDTTILMANGLSKIKITENSENEKIFSKALLDLMTKLAKEMVKDGEGVTKLVTVEIQGAKDNKDAKKCAEAISDSLLCKTAWFGGDPNWGRVIAAIGYSKAEFNNDEVELYYDDYPVVKNSMDAGTSEEILAEIIKKAEFTVKVILGKGPGAYRMWTNDISYDYVKINAEYHT